MAVANQSIPMIDKPEPANDDTPDPFEGLTPRTARLLRGQGLTTVQQVIAMYPEPLLDIRNFGYKSLREVERCFLRGKHYLPR